MSGRNQSVKIDIFLSCPTPLSFRVPQSPLVFILYTHALCKLISSFKNNNHHLYAEDTKIYITITPENATTVILELQTCLESVQSWMDSSKPKLSPDKTEVIIFGSKVLRNKLLLVSNQYP